MIKFSINEALEIQARHISWYGDLHPKGVEGLRHDIQQKTNIPPFSDRDTPISIYEINAMVPRGSDIESHLESLQK
jgi:hypothetical protein